MKSQKRFVFKRRPSWIRHLGFAILDFLIFPRPTKTAKIDQEVIKINKLTRK